MHFAGSDGREGERLEVTNTHVINQRCTEKTFLPFPWNCGGQGTVKDAERAELNPCYIVPGVRTRMLDSVPQTLSHPDLVLF